AQDYLLFLFFWGLQVVPVFLLIAGWGGEGRRRAAGRYLGMALTALALLTVAVVLVVAVAGRAGHPTFDLGEVNGQKLESLAPGVAAAAFWLSLVGFSLWLAIVPLHRWMIEACSEATSGVAMLIVGVVVQLGGYGLIRVMLGAFPQTSRQFSLLLVALAAGGALWAAISAMVQDEVRRMVLYGSASQMAVILLAIGAQTSLALNGVVLMMLAHGFAYGMLLLLTGAVEERGRTRLFSRLGGLAWQAPRLGWMWAFAAFAALGAPLLAGFTAELMVFTGAFPAHRIATVLVMGGAAVSTGFLLLGLQRIFFGPPRETFARVKDITTLEITCVTPMVAALLFFGLLPRAIIPVITSGVTQIGNRLAGGG
ncbi:MAG: NuoM family protein, partial [Candidatus Dormibacteria bacterium]